MAPAASTKMNVALKLAATIIVPSIPVGIWYYSAVQDRKAKAEEVRTRVRVPNVQTIDDLMIEKCKPGDVILFDRRCHKCAAGPVAALSCFLGKSFLCDGDGDGGKTRGVKTVETGSFDHCGIVVPGKFEKKSEALDPSNLLLLEAAPSGILARPLLTRLEMSQSRTVLLLPLASPGERRNDEDYEPTLKTKRLQDHFNKALIKFRDTWIAEGEKQSYKSAHSTLGIIGALSYATGLYKTSKSPVSPSAWLVTTALMESGVGLNISERTAFETRVEDFLRDHRFNEKDCIRLRPGWRFLPPVIMRENSKS
mmetsp:Transcript_12204/g.22884  ORF Transcript_12204/g.22884 Transcript_12204/m.22884 type:complete len:310 (-) Transcript_12204:36-965(-)